MLREVIQSMRPHQWYKNFVVFIAIILTTTSAVFDIIHRNFIRYSKIVATDIHSIPRTCITLLLIFLLFSGFIYRAIFIFRDIEFLTDFWLFEDAFYSLNIAKNIAEGSGWTFDGVVPTNGFQPLYVFLMVPVYWAFKNDIITPIYVALTFLAVFNVITGYLLYRISFYFTKNALSSFIVTAIWLFNPSIARNGTNGLETGLSTFFFALSIFYYVLYIRNGGQSKYRDHLLFGLILGGAYLARIDNIFIIILVGADQLLIHLRNRVVFSTELSRKYLLSVLAFTLTVAPYTAYNYIRFSYPLPLSGAVLKNHPSIIQHFAFNFCNTLHNITYIIIGKMSNSGGVFWGQVTLFNDPDSMMPVLSLIFIMICISVIFIQIYKYSRQSNFIVASILYAIVFISAYEYQYSNFIFERYFYPIVFIILVIVSTFLNVLSIPSKKNISILAMLFMLLLTSNIFAFEKISSENYYIPGWYNGTSWLNENLSEYDTVAASQCGNTGYFFKGRSINLDGVVNYNAYRAYKSQELLQYFEENHITYLADESDWVFIALEKFNNPEDENIIKSRMRLVHRTNKYAYNIYIINNSIRYTQIIDTDSESISKKGTWHAYSGVSHINNTILMSWDKGDEIQFTTNYSCAIRFLRHPWSGMANIYLDGSPYETIDLYYPVTDPTFDFYIPISKPTAIKVEVAGEKNDESQGYQVWADAIFYE